MTTSLTRRGLLAATAALGVAGPAAAQAGTLRRAELFTTADDGVRLHVREISPPSPRGAPLVLLHGARAPGVASFDLPVAGGSLAGDLALRLNRRVYLLDARGYGGSQRPAAMSRPPGESRPLTRVHAVARDIDAARRLASQRAGGQRVGLIGWATGGLWAGFYAALRPETVSGLATFNAL